MTDLDRTNTPLDDRLERDNTNRGSTAMAASDRYTDDPTRRHERDAVRAGESLYGRAWGWSGASDQNRR